MRKLVAIAFILALLGASMQCVADCMTEKNVPPCHRHSQSKSDSPAPCKHAQTPTDQPAAVTVHVSHTADSAEAPVQPPQLDLAFQAPRDRLLLALRI